MQKGNKKFRNSVIIFLTIFIVMVSLVAFLQSTTYLSCYVMSFGVKEGYMDKQLATLPEYQQEAIRDGTMSVESMNPSPEFIQDAGYNYCLSFAPELPEVINVEFESDEEP